VTPARRHWTLCSQSSVSSVTRSARYQLHPRRRYAFLPAAFVAQTSPARWVCRCVCHIGSDYSYIIRGGSRILQGRVSNPSETGTEGWAPKAPRAVGLGTVPLPQKIFVFLTSKWWVFMHFRWYLLTVLFKKEHLDQEGGCPDTLDTPWIRPVIIVVIKAAVACKIKHFAKTVFYATAVYLQQGFKMLGMFCRSLTPLRTDFTDTRTALRRLFSVSVFS